MKLLFNNYSRLNDENFKSIWGALYSDFNSSKSGVLFYTLFFIRRIILSASFIYFREYPIIQVLSCGIMNLIVRPIQIFVYVTVVRPFIGRVQNILNIVTELNITLGYSFNIFFVIQAGINYQNSAWIILASIISTCAIHNILMFYNVIGSIIRYIRTRRNLRQGNTTLEVTNNIRSR
jgi:hypothetical protein